MPQHAVPVLLARFVRPSSYMLALQEVLADQIEEIKRGQRAALEENSWKKGNIIIAGS